MMEKMTGGAEIFLTRRFILKMTFYVKKEKVC